MPPAEPTLTATAPSAPLPTIMPLKSEELCWLRSRDGRFLSAAMDGSISMVNHVRSWEWFTLIIVSDRVVMIMTHQSTFLCVDDENVTHVPLTGKLPGVAAQFEVCAIEGGVTLRNVETRGLLSALPFAGSGGNVKCVSSGFADGESVLWADAKGYLPAVAKCEAAAAPSSSAHVQRLHTGATPATSPKTERPPEIRRNAATGDVVVIAPERLARLKVDPFKRTDKTEARGSGPNRTPRLSLASALLLCRLPSQTSLFASRRDSCSSFGLSSTRREVWRGSESTARPSMRSCASRGAPPRPAAPCRSQRCRTPSCWQVSPALLTHPWPPLLSLPWRVAGPAAGAHFPTPPPTPGDGTSPDGKGARGKGAAADEEEPLPAGLPIPPKSTAPYVARLVAQALPLERAALVMDKAGMCPFCSKCRDDVPAPGEVVNADAAPAPSPSLGLPASPSLLTLPWPPRLTLPPHPPLVSPLRLSIPTSYYSATPGAALASGAARWYRRRFLPPTTSSH